MRIYYVSRGIVKSQPLSTEQSMFARSLNVERGEMRNPGEDLGVQFWQGKEGSNFFILRSVDDVCVMIAMAAKAGSTYQWMACNSESMGIPSK